MNFIHSNSHIATIENHSTSSFTNLMNSAIQSSNHQNPNTQQQPGFPPHFPMNFPPNQFGPNQFPPHQYYAPNFNPFGVQPGYQFSAAGYQHGIPFTGNFHGGDMASGPSSPVGSLAMLGVGCSRGEGSASPVTSPMLPAEHTNKDAIRGEDWSDVDSDEEKKDGRMYWSEEDSLRLISSWINNSNDPIEGNSKSGPRYWKQVADEYNMYGHKGKKRAPTQCKNHWNTTSTLISKFHGCWVEISNTYVSGRSEQQLMEMVHEEYKRMKQTDKPFPFEYWWRGVKDEPKWLNRDVVAGIRNKRNKVSESEAYTCSSNQDTELAEETERRRPPGQKQAKEQRKGKRKLGKGRLSDENVGQFNTFQARKQETIDNMAAATREHAQAIAVMAATDKEKLKIEKIKQYNELMMVGTSSFTEAQKARHEKMLDFLADAI